MPSLNIIVAEDYDVLRESMVQVLRGRGHRVVGVMCAEEVDDCANRMLADLYIVDVNLPGEDGLGLVRRIRDAEPSAGIIVITGRNYLNDRLNAYSCGADVFLSKPVNSEELAACVDRMNKRIASTGNGSALVLDTVRDCLMGPAGKASLSRTEVMVMAAMNRAAGRHLEYWQLMEYVDPAGKGLSRASLEMCMSALRKKLTTVGVEGPSILAIRGVGYRLCPIIRVEGAA